MKILIVGEQERCNELHKLLIKNAPETEVEISDGDPDEDFEQYDVLFDLNFDDDAENFPRYAAMRDKTVFVSAAKLQLAEVVYASGSKVRCRLFGINALPGFLTQQVWEISIFRKFETPHLEVLMSALGIRFLPVEDRVGLVKPRVIFMIINEAAYTLQEGTATIEDIDQAMKLGANYPFGPFEWCDKIGITHVFETLAAIYDDTKDERYKICPLLKTKYLRNETFYKKKKVENIEKSDKDFW